MRDCVLVLHNIRSAHNAGSMFRTADGAGVSRVILSGYTPGPTDPRGKERAPFIKVSLGAEKIIPYSRAKVLSTALKKLKKEGYTIVAIEQNKKSKSGGRDGQRSARYQPPIAQTRRPYPPYPHARQKRIPQRRRRRRHRPF